jgi:hypothetical protein
MYSKCTKCNSTFPLSYKAIALLSVVCCPFCGNLAEEYSLKRDKDNVIK